MPIDFDDPEMKKALEEHHAMCADIGWRLAVRLKVRSDNEPNDEKRMQIMNAIKRLVDLWYAEVEKYGGQTDNSDCFLDRLLVRIKDFQEVTSDFWFKQFPETTWEIGKEWEVDK